MGGFLLKRYGQVSGFLVMMMLLTSCGYVIRTLKNRDKTQDPPPATESEEESSLQLSQRGYDLSELDQVQEQLLTIKPEQDIWWSGEISFPEAKTFPRSSFATIRESLEASNLKEISSGSIKIKIETKSGTLLAASSDYKEAFESNPDFLQFSKMQCSEKYWKENAPEKRFRICNFATNMQNAVAEEIVVKCTASGFDFNQFDYRQCSPRQTICVFVSGNVPKNVKGTEPRTTISDLNLSSLGGIFMDAENPTDPVMTTRRKQATVLFPISTTESATVELNPDPNGAKEVWVNRTEEARKIFVQSHEFQKDMARSQRKVTVTFKLEWLRAPDQEFVSL